MPLEPFSCLPPPFRSYWFLNAAEGRVNYHTITATQVRAKNTSDATYHTAAPGSRFTRVRGSSRSCAAPTASQSSTPAIVGAR
jgi:hypothetical protein